MDSRLWKVVDFTHANRALAPCPLSSKRGSAQVLLLTNLLFSSSSSIHLHPMLFIFLPLVLHASLTHGLFCIIFFFKPSLSSTHILPVLSGYVTSLITQHSSATIPSCRLISWLSPFFALSAWHRMTCDPKGGDRRCHGVPLLFIPWELWQSEG